LPWYQIRAAIGLDNPRENGLGLAARPGYLEARLNLGVAHSRAGNLEAAATAYRDLVAMRPRYVSGWYNLSVVLGRLDRDDEERQAVKRALACDPNHLPSIRKAARLAYREARYADSAIWYGELLDRDPHDEKALRGLGRIYLQQEKWHACAQAAEKALIQSPQSRRAQGRARHLPELSPRPRP
jgi:tetratricopeptide (TPR) repeat protein